MSPPHPPHPTLPRWGTALACALLLGLGLGGWRWVQPQLAQHRAHTEASAPASPHPTTPATPPTAPPVSAPTAHPAHTSPVPTHPDPAPTAFAVLPLPGDPAIPATACVPLVARLPALNQAQCLAAQLAPSGVQSVQGRPIDWRDVAPSAPERRQQRVLIVGAIHGDELTAATLALHWIPFAEAEVRQRDVHWRFIPLLNPDGLYARPATRTNASGVDLNRNFPTPGWKHDAPVYWEKRTRKDPRRWPGPQPLSEPESRFLHEQIKTFQPQLVVSIHAPYGVLDFDGPQKPPQRLGQLWLDQLGVFPGSLGHYSGIHLGVPVVTIELRHALDMPPAAEVADMWRDLLRWMDRHLSDDGEPQPPDNASANAPPAQKKTHRVR